jgi:protein-tyrosine phosphatase
VETDTQFFDKNEVDYFHFPICYWSLAPGANTEKGFAQICAPLLGWVSARLAQGHSVLVHCMSGAHRAGATGIACLMHLSNLDALAAIREAKSRRKEINPYVHDYLDFLNRLQIARGMGSVDLAIEEAARSGFEKSMALHFQKPTQ